MPQGKAARLALTLLASLIVPASIASAHESAPAAGPPSTDDAATAEALRKAAQNPVASPPGQHKPGVRIAVPKGAQVTRDGEGLETEAK